MRLNTETGAEPERVETVALGIVRVPLKTPTLPPATRTNAYIVRGNDGLWVVDPGAPGAGECAVLGDAMRAAEADFGLAVVGAILTHHHPDHVGGLGWWADAVGLPVVADRRTIPLVSGALPAAALGRAEALEWVEVSGDALVDGLHLVFTPGHAPGHLAVWTGEGGLERAPRVLIAGDLVAGIGTIVVNPPRGDMAAYVRSLEAAAELGPELLLPAHGPGTEDAVDRLRQYRDHRLDREERIVAALLERGWRDSIEITRDAYADVPEFLHGWAERSVLAHLIKLIDEGRVEQDEERYRFVR